MRQKNSTYLLLTAVLAIGLVASMAVAQEKKEEAPKQVLFRNVNIFDGMSDELKKGMNVLVEGNLIKQIGKGLKANADATVINGGGRTFVFAWGPFPDEERP
jgi:uncharacterized protein YdeI (BOF family)